MSINLFFFIRTYRYAAYRQFTWWVHNKLGKAVRRVIPSCAVNLIRKTFPSPDGVYTGFLEGKLVDENAFSWTYQNEDNNEEE